MKLINCALKWWIYIPLSNVEMVKHGCSLMTSQQKTPSFLLPICCLKIYHGGNYYKLTPCIWATFSHQTAGRWPPKGSVVRDTREEALNSGLGIIYSNVPRCIIWTMKKGRLVVWVIMDVLLSSDIGNTINPLYFNQPLVSLLPR